MVNNPLRRPVGPRNPHPFEVEQNRESPNKVWKDHFVAMSGEFVGTIMFLFFAFSGTQIANNITPATEPSLQRLLFISLSFGFSLAVTAWNFYRISGGLFNPAVSVPRPLRRYACS